MNTESKPRHAAIIYNPLAGRGKASSYAEQSKKHLTQQNWQVSSVVATEYAEHLETVLAKQCGKEVQLIVLIGGDGSLRKLVSGLRAASINVDIAFIPIGNANVVARELNIPLDPQDAIKLSTSGQTKKVDIGVLKQQKQNDIIFLAMLEIGFGAKIVQAVDRLRNNSFKTLYRFWGDLVYIIAGLLALRGPKQNIFTIKTKTLNSAQTITGKKSLELTSEHTVIANMRTYAKGWSLAPDARCDDGLLDITVSKKTNAWTTLKTFLAASQQRKLKPNLMAYQQAESLSISAQPSSFVQIDGSPASFSGEAEINIEKGAFSIVVKAP